MGGTGFLATWTPPGFLEYSSSGGNDRGESKGGSHSFSNLAPEVTRSLWRHLTVYTAPICFSLGGYYTEV